MTVMAWVMVRPATLVMTTEVPLKMHWEIYPIDRTSFLLFYPTQGEFGLGPEGRKSILGGEAPRVKTCS